LFLALGRVFGETDPGEGAEEHECDDHEHFRASVGRFLRQHDGSLWWRAASRSRPYVGRSVKAGMASGGGQATRFAWADRCREGRVVELTRIELATS